MCINMYIIICETDRQSRFNAWDRVIGAGALGWSWGMGWGRRWEGGSGWGTHVHPRLIHVNVWQKPPQYCKVQFSSVQFSRSVMSYSFRPHELQHVRPPCPSLTPRVNSNSCSSNWWCHPAISSSVVPFSSCPQWVNSSHEVAEVLLEFQL